MHPHDTTKVCRKCSTPQPLNAFGKNSKQPDGLQKWCKACWYIYRRSRPKNDPADHDKCCAQCGETKPADAFQKNSAAIDGLASWCKDCCHAYVYETDYRARKIGYNSARYRDKNEEILIKSREYHADPVVRARKQAYEFNRQRTDPAYRARRCAWNRKEKRTPKGRERVARLRQQRRDRQRGLSNTLTRAEWCDIVQQQHNTCLACGREFGPELKPTRDHIDPQKGLSKDNCQALCGSCNSSKGAKRIDYRALRGVDFAQPHVAPIDHTYPTDALGEKNEGTVP